MKIALYQNKERSVLDIDPRFLHAFNGMSYDEYQEYLNSNNTIKLRQRLNTNLENTFTPHISVETCCIKIFINCILKKIKRWKLKV